MPKNPDTDLRAYKAKRPQIDYPHYLQVMLIAVLHGVLLPWLLVSIRIYDRPSYLHHIHSGEILPIALVICGPGAIMLALLIHALLIELAAAQTLGRLLLAGAVRGIFFAFVNVPIFVVLGALKGDSYLWVRIPLLLVVSGASNGLWIAWQAWRAWRPVERFIPQFSLRTLLLIVLIWGGLLLVFQPRQWAPERPPSPRE